VPGVLDGVQTGIYFEDRNSEAVLIRLNATFREQVYEVETAASLLNIGDSILISASGSVIEFVPGIPVNANINARPIETITIRTEPVTLVAPVDGHVAFIADVLPTDASQKTVKWEFTNPVDYASIVSTSATTGLLKFEGAEAGDIVNVRAVAMDGSGVVSNVYTITVSEDAPANSGDSVTVKSDYDYIYRGNGMLQMDAEITPAGSTVLEVEWSLSPININISINEEGELKTTAANTYTGPITVTATLPTGETGSKTINVIENITEIEIEEVSAQKIVKVGGNLKYTGKFKCTLLPVNKPATIANGVTTLTWSVAKESNQYKSSVIHENADGTIDLEVLGNNANAKFSVTATIKHPISGEGLISNKIIVEFSADKYN
jgi:hypothetical protein